MNEFKRGDRVKWTPADNPKAYLGTFRAVPADSPHAGLVEMDDDPGVPYCLMLSELDLVEVTR